MNKNLKILIGSLLCVIMIMANTSNFKAEASQKEFAITATENKLVINASGYDQNSKLVSFRPNQYHKDSDFIADYDGVGDNNKKDGYSTDRDYYTPNLTGTVEKVGLSDSFEIDRFTNNRDKAYDKFYIVDNSDNILAGPMYVTSLPSKQNYAREQKQSIKGLEVFNVDDAENLGVSHSAITLDLTQVFSSESSRDKIEFECAGKKYYYKKSQIEYYDKMVTDMNKSNMTVTFVIVFWGHTINYAPSMMVHPDYKPWGNDLSIASPNMTTEESIDAFISLFEFIGERYTREDNKYGKVSNFIIGNELNSAYIWNNMGYIPQDEYVRQYERGLRLAHTAIKKYWSNANVLMSLDNHWTVDSGSLFGANEFVGKGSFTAKSILHDLALLTSAEGNYPWHVAFHPYALGLQTPVFWDNYSLSQAPKNENAPRLTPYNIEILPQFLAKEEMLYNGQSREMHFTEQGYSSPHDDNYSYYDDSTYDPENMDETWLGRQVAAYAWAQYKFKQIGAKSNIFHRQFDVQSEMLNIGLWTRVKGTNWEPHSKKPIWEVFKYIDTEKSLEYTNPYLKYIVYDDGTSPSSWSELIDGFEDMNLADRVAPIETTATINNSINVDDYLENFESGKTDFEGIFKTKSIKVIKHADYAKNGEYSLLTNFGTESMSGGGNADKGITLDFKSPMDMSSKGKFVYSVKPMITGSENVQHISRIKFFSGEQVYEASVNIKTNEYNTVVIDIADWSGFKSVDKIRILYSSVDHNQVAGQILYDSIGFSNGKTSGGDKDSGCFSKQIDSTLSLSLLALTGAVILNKRRKKGASKI